MKKYIIRPALPSEAETLSTLAFISKAYWGYPKEWLEAWKDELAVTPEMIQSSISFVAELDGQIVGFWCRAAADSLEPSEGRLFIHPDHIKQGLGRRLWDAVRESAANRGIRFFTFEADPNAAAFYIKMGAQKVGEKESTVVPGRMFPIVRFEIKSKMRKK